MSAENLDALLARLSFELPPERIAQTGAEPRDASRLMVVEQERLQHRVFRELPDLLRPGDVLVFNESRVIPARVMAHKPSAGGQGGGRIEVLLLRQEVRPELGEHVWSAYLKPAKRAGNVLLLGDVQAEVVGVLEDGARLLSFPEDILPHLERIGTLPLPPYIATGDAQLQDADFQQRYQTVYAQTPGSVAAPTAGLHFTPELLARLDSMGVQRAAITLHVGAGTFKPISGPVSEHVMHAESFDISQATADAVNRAKREGRRVVAVGTTSVRALQSAWDGTELHAGPGDTSIFITPGYASFVPDLLITNLHLPGSTLLLLVAAFAGEERIRAAYSAALDTGYRFYSLGDAMLLERAEPPQS
ncbi:tRNA preQ1(34) S-adenosylmethionine ribosyltransferase-isomerase QueA [Deinococcus sp. KNUC1210]|uniref:tRNA preQ1(34) S-adenosylmethionine ribosyltransferase-isomerase QueA n=1 Tax=Deinococcus sp. KNUC1210 TaxID=2917691 RepID=UPI001EEF8AFA|nr:tRNA preQ1(34) S-adenosylmethionine ribosyltransferase-isomerase QueA [Deinococcus sp. KNUC1210]ULH16319.1 tRNA preQ1(34) S-adenosylmethionine ribosyltransferase-isomerase QueA [Deinococcus sp. KNUC1210]